MTVRIGIIGAGLAGLAAASVLDSPGRAVTLFDKGRGPGGRMSTRRGPNGRQFDHGAQFFTARDPNFAAHVEAWVDQGVAAPWRAKFASIRALSDGPVTEPFVPSATRYVGTPSMSAVLRAEAQAHTVSWGVKVEHSKLSDGRWAIMAEDGSDLGVFEGLVFAVPAPQAQALLARTSLEPAIRSAQLSPCWSVMAAFDEPLDLPFDAAEIEGWALSWVARDNSKPGRPGGECWVLQASPDATRDCLEAPAPEMARHFFEAFRALVGPEFVPEPVQLTAHRWRYARAEEAVGEPALVDADRRVAICGDWLLEPRVEGAWMSGRAAGRLLGPLL